MNLCCVAFFLALVPKSALAGDNDQRGEPNVAGRLDLGASAEVLLQAGVRRHSTQDDEHISRQHAEFGSGSVAGRRRVSSSSSLDTMPRPTPHPAAPTVLEPAAPLKWTKVTHIAASVQINDGFLTVNLDPDNKDSPKLKLEVKMFPAEQQPAPRGALIVHCGGPSSGAECGRLTGAQYRKMGFDIFGISQRGIGGNIPSLNCNNSVTLPTKGKGPYVVSDFTDCPCRLPDGTPMIGETWADIDPGSEKEVRDLFSKMTERSSRCYKSFQLTNKYNLLDYIGTQYLAYDIEILRKAIGAAKISLYGQSYGTSVGATYATVFPDKVDKLVLNGNVVPYPEKNALSTGCAAGMQQGINKLLYNCKKQAANCSLKDPEREYDEVIDLARLGNLTAKTASGKRFRLTVGYLTGWIQLQLGGSDGNGWSEATKVLASLRGSNDTAREDAVAKLLNTRCKLIVNDTAVLTWYDYDVCIGSGHIAGGTQGERFIDQVAVFGADLAGRYTVTDAVRLWSEANTHYGVAGAGAFVGIMAGLFDWPVVPTPPAPLGNPNVKALVVGNLYDPSTSYKWSQEMHKVFPGGFMLTWQGVGHILTKAPYDKEGSYACVQLVEEYMRGENPIRNGYTCHNTKPVPAGLIQW